VESWLVSLLAFAGTFLAVIAANAVLVELSSGERRRIKREVQELLRERMKVQIRTHDLDELVARSAPSQGGVRARLASLIAQSGVSTTMKQLLGIAALIAILSAALIFFLFRFSAPSSAPGESEGLFGLVCRLAFQVITGFGVPTITGGLLPILYLLYARKSRQEKLLAQLPDAFELMSRVLRSGQTINYAMQIVADQGAPPLALEFFHCNEQMNLGMAPEAALRDLAHRTGLLEMRIFTVAILVQRQTGGNLSVLFDKMGTMVRERYRIRGMIQSLTAQGRMQALILTSLPIAMFALLMYTQPDYEMELLNYPIMCLTAVGLMALGSYWINRVVNFDY
jgi:tight adherence protein B